MRAKKYTYTIPEIVKKAEVPDGTIRRHISEGLLDPGDLSSVARYIVARRIIEFTGGQPSKQQVLSKLRRKL